jgi:hypothetical protein
MDQRPNDQCQRRHPPALTGHPHHASRPQWRSHVLVANGMNLKSTKAFEAGIGSRPQLTHPTGSWFDGNDFFTP